MRDWCMGRQWAMAMRNKQSDHVLLLLQLHSTQIATPDVGGGSKAVDLARASRKECGVMDRGLYCVYFRDANPP